MKHKDIHFDIKTTHKILKNLCVTLKANNIDYTCGFISDYIYSIKCNKYIIDAPIIKSTSLLYKVTEDNGILWGLFDIKYLLQFLRENLINTTHKTTILNGEFYECKKYYCKK